MILSSVEIKKTDIDLQCGAPSHLSDYPEISVN